MIKVFKDIDEMPKGFTGIGCIKQDVFYTLNGVLYKKIGPAVERADGRTKVYKSTMFFNNKANE